MQHPIARLLGISILASFLLTLAAASYAEEILGCPYGLDKGELWLRFSYNNVEHERRWNSKTHQMEDLPAAWHSRKINTSYRLGYGLTDDIDIGVSLNYGDRRARLGSREISDSALEDIWLAAKYKFTEQTNRSGYWQEKHLAVAAAFKLPQSSDTEVTEGLGNGADAMRIGLLWHLCGKHDDMCGHLTYTFVGKAPVISGYRKSGWDLPDRLTYKLFREQTLTNKLALAMGPSGWVDMDEAKGKSGSSGYRAYSHNLVVKLQYHPNGVDIEHQRLVVGISKPYSVKNNMAPHYVWSFGGMWTW